MKELLTDKFAAVETADCNDQYISCDTSEGKKGDPALYCPTEDDCPGGWSCNWVNADHAGENGEVAGHYCRKKSVEEDISAN
jgi:uncharacterized Zn-finger protein